MMQVIGLDGKLLPPSAPLSAAIKQPLLFRFKPQQDITAFELATLLPYLIGKKPLFNEELDALGITKRHLEQVDTSEKPKIIT